MKQDQSNQLLLFSIASLLIASTALFNFKEKIRADSAPMTTGTNPLDELSIEKAYSSLQHLMASRSVGTIVQMLQGISIERALALAHMIFSSKNNALTREDKAQILLGLVHNNAPEIKKQYQLLDTLKQFRDLKKDKPILISAIHSEYADTIPAILSWMKDHALEEASIINAYSYALMHNDLTGFKRLVGHAVPITTVQATKLITQAITHKKLVEFIPLLIDLGADVNSACKGKTLLMQTVLQNNKGAAEALLKGGADKTINTVTDPKVGTALQLAIEKEHADIDVLLRQYGARE